MELYSSSIKSPIGTIKLQSSGEHLILASFMDDEENVTEDQNAILQETSRQLNAYFKGDLKSFDIPMQQQGTEFQHKIWDLLYKIPYGKTISYNDLAKQYGDTKAIRAVASANGRNNIAIIIPCHRVIGSNRSLTGYAGGLWRKQWLLNHEARFHSGVQQLF